MFAIFPNQAAGFQAMMNDLKAPNFQAMTIGKAIETWAPPKRNDTRAYQDFVSRMTGLPLTTPMSSLNPQQIDTLGRAVQRFEGQATGTSMFWPAPY